MNKSSFFIVGKHAVIEALKNPNRKVLRVFLTEESKKTIHRENQKKNLLKSIKIYFKTKKELDNYTNREQLLHQGYVAEVEHLENYSLKDYGINLIDQEKRMTIDTLEWNSLAKTSGIETGDVITEFKIENLDRPNKGIVYPFALLFLIGFGYLNYRREEN